MKSIDTLDHFFMITTSCLDVGCKLQKNHKSRILSFGWVVDIKKWFKIWDVEDLLELSSDAMKYVAIEERLMKPLRSGKM